MHEGCQDPVAHLVVNLMTVPSSKEFDVGFSVDCADSTAHIGLHEDTRGVTGTREVE